MTDDAELTERLVATLERMSATDSTEETLVAVRLRARRQCRARNLVRASAIAVIVAAIAAPIALLRSDEVLPRAPAVGSVLEIPPAGRVVADFLDDGTPVFVRGDTSGSVDVFAAVSTHVPLGVKKAIGWCASTQVFEDWIHGSSWDRHGVKLDGPAPQGLWTYPTVTDGDRVRVVSDTLTVGAPLGSLAVAPVGRPCYDAAERPGSNVVHFRDDEAVDLQGALEHEPGSMVMVQDIRFETQGGERVLCDVGRDRCARVIGGDDRRLGHEATYGFVRIVDERTVTDVTVYIFPSIESASTCEWDAEVVNSDGAGGHLATVVGLTNLGDTECAVPAVESVVGLTDDRRSVTATAGSFFPIGPAPSSVPKSARVAFIVSTSRLDCDAPASRPIGSLVVTLGEGDMLTVPLREPVETACEFGFSEIGSYQ